LHQIITTVNANKIYTKALRDHVGSEYVLYMG